MPRLRAAFLGGLLATSLSLPGCGGSPSSPSPVEPAPLGFSPSVRVGGLCCLLYAPAIAVEGDVVYVAWTEAIRFTTYLPMRRSLDGGRTFPDELSFSDATRGDRDRIHLAAAPGRGLHVAWQDSRDGVCDPFCRGYHVYTTLSADRGARFAANLQVDGDPQSPDQLSPTLAFAAGGEVDAAWEAFSGRDREIRFARSHDGGGRFEGSLRVDDAGESPRDQRSPAIAVEPDGRIHLAWLDRRSGVREVYLARSEDHGARFQVSGPLHPREAAVEDRDGLSLSLTGEGRLVAVWTELREGRWRVQRATSLDAGATFTAPRPVDGSDLARGDQLAPALAVFGARTVYVAWEDHGDGPGRVRIARSTDGADSFETSVLVADPGASEGEQRAPALALHGGGDVLVAWVDFTRPNGGVFSARSR